MALREILAVFGYKVDDSELKKADERVSSAIEKLKKLAEVAATAFGIERIVSFVEGQAELADAIDDTAVSLGATTEQVQTFAFAARSAGDDAGELINAISMLETRAGDEGPAKAFAKLGIAVKDSSGHLRPAADLFTDVADKLSALENPTERAGLAVDIFGKTGRKILPILSAGTGGLAKLTEEMRELGGGVSREAIEAGAKFEKSTARLGVALTTLKSRIATVLFPVFKSFAEAAVSVGKALSDLVKTSSIVEATFAVLGVGLGFLAVKMAVAFAPLLGATLAIGVLVLLVEDLVTLFQGGKSAVGDFIDSFAGAGAATQWVRDMRDGVRELLNGLEAVSAVQRLVAASASGDVHGAAQALNRVAELSKQLGPAVANTGVSDLQRQRIEASKSGQVFIAPGETFEQAKAATQAAATFGPSADIPVTGGGGGTTIVSPIEVNLEVPAGANKEEWRRSVENIFDDSLARRNRQAADALNKIKVRP